MFNPEEAAAIAAMSVYHGSYNYLCEVDGHPVLAHTPVGRELYHYPPPLAVE